MSWTKIKRDQKIKVGIPELGGDVIYLYTYFTKMLYGNKIYNVYAFLS